MESEKKRNIIIETVERTPIEQQRVELVERKGIGHPDTICDAVCEAASRELSKYYLKEFGRILHHNLDKGLLVAGSSQPKFGGGKVIEPIHIVIAGRATNKVGNKVIPVDEIVINAAQEYIQKNVPSLQNVKIDAEIRPGSADLQEVFKKVKGIPLANDTSFGVSFAPPSETEKIVLRICDLLNSDSFCSLFPAVGKDIKVMGLRANSKIKLIIAIAFIDKYIRDAKQYFHIKEEVGREILKEATKLTKKEVEILINTLDNPNAKTESEVYLTVTGLSAEIGDDGQCGRGNRVNGLITPNREMSLEAVAGKNPVSHVGKIYNVLAQFIAEDIAKKTGSEVYVKLLSSIGKPIDQPSVASVHLLKEIDEKTKKEVYEIANSWLAKIEEITKKVIEGRVRLY